MKKLKLMTGLILLAVLFTQCKKDNFLDPVPDDLMVKKGTIKDTPPKGTFTVTIKNVSTTYDYFAAGAKFIQDGGVSAGPAFPGHSFSVSFHAGKAHKLSFATMYGASNDLFYAPADGGIALFNGNTPLTGDITSMISLWDAGTEENHAPASGEQGADESVPVKSVRNTDNVMDGFSYNAVEENIQVLLDYDGTSMFTLTVKNLAQSSTPLSPVAWVVHYETQKPIFTEGALEYGNGLENIAETGNASPLSTYLSMHSGYVSPIAPGVWVVHKKGFRPIFNDGKMDYGMGLEMLSEMGDPSVLASSLMTEDYVSGVYNTPDGGGGPAPLLPGDSYTFTIAGTESDYLSFASMLGKSNDLFFAPNDMGIKLFKGLVPVSGDITGEVMLWDTGTEPNEYPGAGIHQGPGGTSENGVVMQVNDGFTYPAVNQMMKVTIMKN